MSKHTYNLPDKLNSDSLAKRLAQVAGKDYADARVIFQAVLSDANGAPISKDQWESAVRVKAGMRANKIWPIIRRMLSDHRMVQATVDKTAHPVWDLDSEGHGDPVIVRKVPEMSERGKTGDPGWLGRQASIFIDGRQVIGKIASVDGACVSLDVNGETVTSDMAFVSFLADRDNAGPSLSRTKTAAPRSIFQEWKDLGKALKQQFTPSKRNKSKQKNKLDIKQEEQEGGMPVLDGGKNPDGSMVLPDPEDLREFLIKLLPSLSGKSAMVKTAEDPPVPPGLGINVTPPSNIRGPIVRPMVNELVRGIDNIRRRSIDRMIDVYKQQIAPRAKERKYMEILWWWNREAIIQNQLGQIIQVLDKTYRAPMKGTYEQKPMHEVQVHPEQPPPLPPDGTTTTPSQPEQLDLFKKTQALIRDELMKAAQRMGPNAASTFELQYIIRTLVKFGFPIDNKQALISVLELNKNHEVSNVVERVPDVDWMAFIQNVGKPAADDSALIDSRPEWWTQYKPIPSDSEERFDEYDIDEASPMSMDEAMPKQGQSGEAVKRNWQALEWLWWMADAGFSINSYENMKELAVKFPVSAHRGPALAASMTDIEYEDLWRSGQINQYGRMLNLPEKMKEHSEGPRGPVEDAWPPNYRKWRETVNVNEPVKVIREVPKNDMMETGEESEMSMDDVRPRHVPSRMTNNDPKTTGMSPVTQMPQRIPLNAVRPLPGFVSGQILKQPGGKLSVLIAKPGGKDKTTAHIGQGVMLRKFGQGLGYIVGQADDGKPIVWLEKLQDLRAIDASEIELDLKGSKLASIATIVADALRNAQIAQPMPGQVPTSNVSVPGMPKSKDGQPAQPGDIVMPADGSSMQAGPDNTGTVQNVGADGTVVMKNQTGEEVSVQPGQQGQQFETVQNVATNI
jgi:hypothetical protein